MTPPLATSDSIALRMYADPVFFVEHALGFDLWSKQREILYAIRDNSEVRVKSCHGVGKSFIASGAGLWYTSMRTGSIAVTTAPTDRQVRKILWKEIRKAHRHAKLPLGGRLLTQDLIWAEDWWMMGFASSDYDENKFQGIHAESIILLVDEACGVSQPVYTGMSGLLSSEGAKRLQIGNPTEPDSEFGRHCDFSSGVTIHIGAFDTPNFTAFGIVQDDITNGTWQEKITGPLPRPYLVTPKWVADRHEEWGLDSPDYTSRVLGQFPEGGEYTLIQADWIKAAQDRDLPPKDDDPNQLGVDVARFGDDESVIMHRLGARVRLHWSGHGVDTMELANLVMGAMDETGAVVAKVDVIGVGGGVVDRLRQVKRKVVAFDAAGKALKSEWFANVRAEAWWALRERFKDGEIDIDLNDLELAKQLKSIRYHYDAKGKLQIESKEKAKKRLRGSPDRGDAVMQVFYKGNRPTPRVRRLV